jgi:hypothetical protein
VADVTSAVAKAVERIQLHDEPWVEVGVPPPRAGPVDEVLERIRTESYGLARRVEGIKGREWQRCGRLPSGLQISTMDLVRHAVHVGTHHRRLVEGAMATVLLGPRRTGDLATD